MTSPINWLILAYALLVAAGGIAGYLKAKSTASLASGLGSGAALAIAWFISLQMPTVGLGLAAAIALALVVVFIRRFKTTGKFMPAGMLAIGSGLATIVFAVSCLRV